jgi:hypothetical protein
MINRIFIQPYKIEELLIFVLIEYKKNERVWPFLFYFNHWVKGTDV